MSVMEFAAACFAPANAFYSVLLLGMFLYWFLLVWGMLDLDMGTPDADLDMDMDVDVDAGVDAPDGDLDVAVHHAPSAQLGEIILEKDRNEIPDYRSRRRSGGRWYFGLMRWMGIGRVPLMVYMSLLVPALWVLSLAATRHWGRDDIVAFLVLLVPVWGLGVLAAKLLSVPFGWLFRKANTPGTEDRMELAGAPCRVLSLAADENYGQADLTKPGFALTINVRTRPGVKLARGDDARVVSGPDGKDVYLIEPLAENAEC